ncbi:MAG TPA: hypothetical protein VMU62_04920 [Acidobacteriaceae bacterium]|nr:hypothetical protein [Acidobacteriaceae bacterium]
MTRTGASRNRTHVAFQHLSKKPEGALADYKFNADSVRFQGWNVNEILRENGVSLAADDLWRVDAAGGIAGIDHELRLPAPRA